MTHAPDLSDLRGPGTNSWSVGGKTLASLAATRIVRPYGPVKLARLTSALVRWGTGPAGGFASLAARMPEGLAVVDELGELTFGRLHRESNALARALAQRGVGEGDRVALMCRNHRWFIEATVAISRLGADVLYLNTAFSGPQVVELLERERPVVVIHDEEFAQVVADAPSEMHRVLAWQDGSGDTPTVADAVGAFDTSDLAPPEREGRSVILTSGTTGTPKGANRGAGSLTAAAALTSRIPLRYGRTVHIAAPMFHTWGWAHLNLAMLLGSTLVLTRRFDPENFLATVQQHQCDTIAVIPVMLHRVMELPEQTLDAADLSSVRVVAASGSALPGTLASDWMDRFGDNLYNTYGSTECAWVTIATPDDMRRAPGTAGAPPIGTRVAVLDDVRRPVEEGRTGLVFVANTAQFEGYTNGENKEMFDGMMATGDVGRIEGGLLFVEGRDDDMIVSGGENVYPQEVEECLVRHPAVSECAVVGVQDAAFGQRLAAFVALHDGSDASEEDLKEYIRAHLARYKVPRDVRFLQELPRNSTGKVLKRHLSGDDVGTRPT